MPSNGALPATGGDERPLGSSTAERRLSPSPAHAHARLTGAWFSALLLLVACGAPATTVPNPGDTAADTAPHADDDTAPPTQPPAWVADLAPGAPVDTVVFAPDATGVDDGLDDTPMLQARLDAAAPGTVVRLAAGTYTLATTLRVPPGVVLAGEGVDRTVLARAPEAWTAFGYGYLVAPAAEPTTGSPPTGVRGLTLDGMRRAGGGAPNQGGGLKAGDHWRVEDLAFRDFNYFRLWLKDTDGVRVRRCTFDDGAAPTSSDNDNIGGGSNTDLLLEDVVIGANTVGNAIDLLNSERLVIDRLHAGRGTVYLEGVWDSEVRDSRLDAGAIVLQTDVGYSSSTRVRNPARNRVVGNTVTGAARIGIAVRYDDAQGRGLPVEAGGGNVVEGNHVVGAGRLGIAVFGADDAAKSAPDVVSDNLVENVLSPEPYTYNIGYGTFDDACIGLGIGTGDAISGNTCQDTQDPPTTRLGIVLGARGGRATVRDTLVEGNVERGLVAR